MPLDFSFEYGTDTKGNSYGVKLVKRNFLVSKYNQNKIYIVIYLVHKEQ